MKLKNRIIIFTVLICIVSIVSMTLINYGLSIKTLEREVNEKNRIGTMVVSKEIDGWVAKEKAYLEELIEGMILHNNFELEYGKAYLKKAAERHGQDYFIAFENGPFIDPDVKEDYDPSDKEWFKESLKTKDTYVSKPDIDEKTGDMVVTISRSFR